jgi:hypothetical protein
MGTFLELECLSLTFRILQNAHYSESSPGSGKMVWYAECICKCFILYASYVANRVARNSVRQKDRLGLWGLESGSQVLLIFHSMVCAVVDQHPGQKHCGGNGPVQRRSSTSQSYMEDIMSVIGKVLHSHIIYLSKMSSSTLYLSSSFDGG